MQAITDWLNSRRDYTQGVDLYIKHGHDPVLRKLFTAEEKSAFKEKKLLQALKGLLEKTKPQAAPLAHVVATHTPHQGWPPQPITDPVISALHQQWKPLYSEMMDLQARIYGVAEAAGAYGDPLKKQEACDMAHRIADLDDDIDAIYYRRDFYLQHHRLPGEQTAAPVTAPHVWPKKLANAERYVREYKNKLSKDPTNASAAAKLKLYEAEVLKYKKLLKLD